MIENGIGLSLTIRLLGALKMCPFFMPTISARGERGNYDLEVFTMFRNFIEWLLDNLSTIIIVMIIAYALACFIDLTAPIDTNRGSWWNVCYLILKAICC